MARAKTKGLFDGELIRLTERHTGAELSLWLLESQDESPGGRRRKMRRYCITAHDGAYAGDNALRALARAILREVPAKKRRGR